jgi:ligand-binding sensor domain-containing protein
VISNRIKFLIFFTCCLNTLTGLADAQPLVSRIITVRDGLPQSFVSGIFQDSEGFLWVSTLNGLGRYDGRQFKQYLHTSANPAGLSGNIVLHLFDARNDNLLVCYLDGKVDKLNTVTERVTHLSGIKDFNVLKNETGYFKSLIRGNNGLCWMMSQDGGLFRIDLNSDRVTHLSIGQLHTNGPVLGIAWLRDQLLLLTQSNLLICDSNNAVVKTVPYPFSIHNYINKGANIYSPGVRPNGDLLISDAEGLKIWNPFSHFLKSLTLKRQKAPGKLIAAFDDKGNYYFEYHSGVYLLRPNNELVAWLPTITGAKGIPTSMFTDRSGVLWVGTNGFGLWQYNLRETPMPGYNTAHSFVYDVLEHYNLSKVQLAGTFLAQSQPYANRVAASKDSVWISDVNLRQLNPQLALFSNGKIQTKSFTNNNKPVNNERHGIQFLCFTKSGFLWGIDQYYQLLRFDTRDLTFRVYTKVNIDGGEELNGIIADGESAFYICTNKNLLKVNVPDGSTERLTSLLPGNYFFCINSDPVNNNVLWIGTMSDGLIRFDKNTKKSQLFSIATGLPNNTVYGILTDNSGLLWCSSNKGIYAFNPKNQSVRSFTSRDGLPVDEFNRYHYMKLPDGDMAFGGSSGYTIFNPAKISIDTFDPQIALTEMDVINKPTLNEPLNTLKEMLLRYDQNFLTISFAAMQFDFPEKNQYRYMLKGIDKNWVMPGNENRASYTSLPSGDYTLVLNSTNTSGKWSRYFRKVKIVISPPFWRTWWFYTVVILSLIILVYWIISVRIKVIKTAQAQKMQFERKAMELHAMALRSRMNPHFIFNSLNSIKALIQEKDDRKAVSYLTTFATLIRKQLDNSSNTILLEDELATCKLYLELEAMRFDGRITYQFSVSDAQLCEISVPPLILQPIIENAIVHGLLPMGHGGRIDISVHQDDDYVICEIEDNGIGRAASAVYKQNGSRLHQSKGINLLEERISMYNRMNETMSSLETVDLFIDGKASGTRVIIKFNKNI